MNSILFWVIIVTVILGVPISFVLLAGPIAAIVMTGSDFYMTTFIQRIFSGVSQYPLLAIPMFLFAGELLNTGRITEKLVDFASDCVGHWRGGLAQVNNLSSLMFAGLSGSALADAASLGKIIIPQMERKGYSRHFSAAVTAAGALIGPIVPPSIIMIIYAYVMNLSVGKLFAAGILPGIMMTAGLMITTNLLARKHNFPREPNRPELKQIVKKGMTVFPAFGAPIVIIGGILGGFFTATEAASVAVLYSLLLGIFWTRVMTVRIFLQSLYRAAIGSGLVLLIIASAVSLGWLMTVLRIPQDIADSVLSLSSSPQIFMLLAIVLLIFAGAVLDAGPAILIFGPILAPLIAKYGIDPTHFAIMMCLNLTIGLATPPFGLVLFTTASVAKVSVSKIVGALWPFLLVHFVILLLIAFIPALTLTIPAILGFQ